MRREDAERAARVEVGSTAVVRHRVWSASWESTVVAIFRHGERRRSILLLPCAASSESPIRVALRVSRGSTALATKWVRLSQGECGDDYAGPLCPFPLLLSTATAAGEQERVFSRACFWRESGAIRDELLRRVALLFQGTFLAERSSGRGGKEVYRFLSLRTFHHAIVIRVDVAKDGTGNLVTKVFAGEAGFGMRDERSLGKHRGQWS